MSYDLVNPYVSLSLSVFPLLPSLPLCSQGVIQDVKLIFTPNGYITQCPNLNRSKYHDHVHTKKKKKTVLYYCVPI